MDMAQAHPEATFPRTWPDSRFWGPVLGGFALWTWLLSFFFFGPDLAAVYGSLASAVGYSFALGHAAGLVLLAYDSRRLRLERLLLWSLVPLTALSLAAPPLLLALPLAALAGLASAGAVLHWLRSVQRAARPGLVLALAAGAANVIVWILGLPPVAAHAEALAGGAVTGLAVVLLPWLMPRDGEAGTRRPQGGQERRWRPPTYLLLFAVAAYVAGGALYGVLAPYAASRPDVAWFGLWPYIAVFVLGAGWAGAKDLRRLQNWSLAAIGAGGVLTAALGLLPWDFPLAWSLVMAGLGLADAYYWRQAIDLAAGRGMVPAGVALSFNVVVVSATSFGMSFAPLPVAGILVAMLVLLLWPALLDATQRQAAERPPGLTRSEEAVLELLLRGGSDAEIASALQISRNTVKFHVRNVLRKTGYANRRDLREDRAPSNAP